MKAAVQLQVSNFLFESFIYPNSIKDSNSFFVFQIDVIFLNAEIFVDPFEEAEIAVEKERENIRLAKTNQESGKDLNS